MVGFGRTGTMWGFENYEGVRARRDSNEGGSLWSLLTASADGGFLPHRC